MKWMKEVFNKKKFKGWREPEDEKKYDDATKGDPHSAMGQINGEDYYYSIPDRTKTSCWGFLFFQIWSNQPPFLCITTPTGELVRVLPWVRPRSAK